ncbi:predicted protein [Uncinocarpus reesii 1704]|uniref:Uncharacterized protein n=1 Tax=Uncinocarpus reesii (strain UAMH 1704) TaxID=336963 RepID=C4JG89_UNCRE|nr:uncharacterized protein UREG_02487 [Uncinocarpus reesii 1704]EEP77638.1 predicted protein [Uncinocarpus reesii 1704]
MFPKPSPASKSPRNPDPMAKRIDPEADHLTSEPLTPVIAAESAANDDDFTFSSPTPGSKEQSGHELTGFSFSTLPPDFEWSSSPEIDPTTALSKPHKRKAQKSPKSAEGTADEGLPTACPAPFEDDARSRMPTSVCKQDDTSVQSPSFMPMVEPQPLSSEETESPNQATTERLPSPAFHEAGERLANGRSDVDLIPDSFSDLLEQQIASQLEQDLELSIDLDYTQNKQTPRPASTGSKKRKRGNVDSTPKERGKRATRNSIASMDSSRVASPERMKFVDPRDKVPMRESPSLIHYGESPESQPNDRRLRRPSEPKSQSRSTKASVSSSQACAQRRSQRLRGKLPAEEMDTACDSKSVENADDVSKGEHDTTAQHTELNDCGEAHESQRDTIATGDVYNKYGPEPFNESILGSLRSVLESIRGVSFDRSLLREIDDVMFDIKVEAHEAVKRHTNT